MQGEATERSARASLAIAGLVAALTFAGVEVARSAPDPTVVFDQTFSSTGAQQFISVPDGVRNVDVTAVGGRGANEGSVLGGRPAQVDGRVDVSGLAELYVVVGGNGGAQVGFNQIGGFNGGGNANGASGAAVGGGGGGASDVRTLPTTDAGTLGSRVLVAGGGGGAGATSNQSLLPGGVGGDSLESGARAASGGPNNTVGSGGFGGNPGTESAGGSGGDGGFPYTQPSTPSNTGSDGGSGTAGQGGSGGAPPPSAPPGGGGAGGGGWFGGGGGGGGMLNTGGAQAVSTGGGGGGGGSSLVPAGGTVQIVGSDSTQPSVRIRYTIPGTEITGPTGTIGDTTPTFDISSGESGTTFECRVDPEPTTAWSDCASPFTTAELADGPHTVEARAVNEMDNFDPTPAVAAFTVDTTPAPPAPSLSTRDVIRNKKKGTGRLPVTVNAPGLITVSGPGLKSTSASSTGAGEFLVPVKPTRKAAKRLRAKGSFRTTATVTFAPTGRAERLSGQRTLKLKRKRTTKKR
jgi:hypothetical protein